MKFRTVAIAFGISLLFAALAGAQAKRLLTNDDIVEMVKAGFEESTIIKLIQSSDASFDTSVSALIALKKASVSQAVIETILASPARKQDPKQVNEENRTESPTQTVPGMTSDLREDMRDQDPAVYVEEVSAGGSQSSDSQLEAIKTLQKSGVRVVTVKEKADYILQITRQLGKKSWKKDTKVVLSDRNGEVLYTNSTRTVGGAMGDIVDFIKKRHPRS